MAKKLTTLNNLKSGKAAFKSEDEYKKAVQNAFRSGSLIAKANKKASTSSSKSTSSNANKSTTTKTNTASTLPKASHNVYSTLANKTVKKNRESYKASSEKAKKEKEEFNALLDKAKTKSATTSQWKKVEGTAATGAGKGNRVYQTLSSTKSPYVSAKDRDAVSLEKNANSKVERFASGLKDGVSLYKPKATTEEGKLLKQIQDNSTAYKAGEIIGETAQYAVPYAGLGGKVGKAVTKVPAVAKLGTVGQNLVKSAAADAVIGLPLNASNTYLKRGLTGDEAKKDLAIQEALDFGLGGLFEVTPAIIKAFKGMKIGSKVIDTADDIAKVTADDVAKMTEEEYKDLIQRAKQGNATDNEMLKITNYVNEKRGKNVSTKDVMTTGGQNKLGGNTTETKALQAPENADKRIDYTVARNRRLKATDALDIERQGETAVGDIHTRLAARELEDAYDEIRSAWGTDYLSNEQIEKLLKDRLSKDSNELSPKYGVNIKEKLKALDDAIAKDKTMTTEQKIRYFDETGIGHMLYGEDFDKLAKDYGNKDKHIFSGKVEKEVPRGVNAEPNYNHKMSDEEVADAQRKLFGNTIEIEAKPTTLTEREIISEESGNIPTPNVPKTVSKTPKADAENDLAFASLNNTGKMKGAYRKFYNAFVSGTAGAERFAKIQKSLDFKATANERAQAVRTSRGTVESIFSYKLVDPAGNVINEKSYKDLIGQIPDEQRELFNTYAQHLHNIDRWATETPVFEQTSAEESAAIVNRILKEHPEFEGYSNDITSWWNDFMDAWAVKTGRTTPEAMAALRAKYPHYIPTYRIGQAITSGSTNSIITKVGKVFKQATGGTSDVIPLEDSFLAEMESIVRSTRKNELYADIVQSINSFPEEFRLFGRSADDASGLKPDDFEFFDEVDTENLKQVSDGVYKLTAYINGEAKSAYINEDLKEALQLLGDTYSSKYGRYFHDLGNIVGMTNLRKTFITALNPVFTVSNMMRDFATYMIQTEAKGFQALSSLGKAAKELATNGEYAQTYRALGGMQAGYYRQGKGYLENVTSANGNPVRNFLSKITQPIQTINEAGESLPRLAEFITLIEKYGDNYEGRLAALQGASDVTTNFARTAPVTKAMDGWILYLNAAVQGIDKFARTVVEKPLTTLGRSAVLLSMPYAALYVANRDNPHYQDLSDRVKQNYFVIPNMLGEVDNDGNAKTFFKIPLNREYGALMASSLDLAFSYIDEGMDGLEMAMNEYGETMKTNLLPPLAEGANFAPIIDVLNNENYAGSKIVPTALEDASPINQTDISTSNAANNIAGFMNHFALAPEFAKSPMKVDYLLSQFGYPGQLIQAATSQEVASLPDTLNNTFIEPFKNRFSADPRYSSGVVSKFYNDKDKITRQVTDEKLGGTVGSSPAKMRQKVYNQISAEISDLSKQEKTVLADSSLSMKEKNEKIKALREQRNELARSAETLADETEEAYMKIYDVDTAELDIKWQMEYAEKYKGAGISGKTYSKAYEAAKAESTDTLKSLAAINATGEGKMAMAFGVSEKSAAKALVLYDAGLTADDFKKAKAGGDSDGNGGVEKDTLMNYLDSHYSDSYQKYALFNALSTAKNPY